MDQVPIGRRIVDIEDPLSWPNSLCELLEGNRDVLSGFENGQTEIDKIPGGRFNSPTNEFAVKRGEVVSRAGEILAAEKILGFHCTRLLPYEAESVRHEGLKLPSPEFLRERIEGAVSEGHLTRELAISLLRNNQAADPNRRDKIGFANARSLLRQRNLVCRFFDSWGGEALYNSHEDDLATGPALKSMGEPYVVVAGLPANVLRISGQLASYFINAFLRSVSVKTRDGAGFESSVEEPVTAGWLLSVIGSTDWRFRLLAG